MSNIGTQRFREVILATQPEEKEIIVKCLPTDLLEKELQRRLDVSTEILQGAFAVLSNVPKQPSLQQMEASIIELRGVLKQH